ncbi:hypothetical protein PC129_g14096 [Phytophthora cactorum]|uniref:MULE transposase domain-containing protein n=2 Tax=Phytophthora cactorum TaxID=29920 RepID=A0A8T1DAE8_9STRA|nr:hypothetical protein Pcac1_g4319 [Phytophthora cactorum]KAG2821364.1 hypothetical protein PC112_g11401 [Phytophthora cactorum]KAG2829975.1 hypothetical protein PC111_g7558 [Phytophthora cactorum]KAG2902926.1 hypothetical protein PC114_g12480 [Phytophthora cactorum]KAG2936839.1 hypothetical protein PC117_g11941 [Phytophthora cactorum]
MVRSPGVDVDVPAMHVLMDSKQQDAYWNALNYVIVQTGRLLEPATVTCDFEHGLVNAITEQFPS